MFIFDIETLGKRSTSVILSWACIHFDPHKKYTYEELCESAFFVKLDAKDQKERLNRYIDLNTVEWWGKQSEIVKNKSFKPNENDMKFEDAYTLFKEWVASKKESNYFVWARGNMDQILFDDLQDQLNLPTIFTYNRWRDVRTAIDLIFETTTGYVKIPGFDPGAKVYKHDPVHDCAYDVMMMLYGNPERINNETSYQH